LARIELSTGTKVNDRRRILELKRISKAFAGKCALADVSLSLNEGQLFDPSSHRDHQGVRPG
jgi:hypothetical protein